MAEIIARIAKIAAVIAFGIIVLAVAVLFMLKYQDKQLTKGRELDKTTKYDVQRANQDSKVKTLVPESRIPKNYQEAVDAAPIELVPGRWKGIPSDAPAGGTGADTATIPTDDRKAIASTIDVFLDHWETYTPGGIKEFNQYKQSLAPYVVSGSLSDIANRVDNHQPDRIGPQPGKIVGSTWGDGYSYEAMTVRSFDGNKAWVTTDGPVFLDAFGDSDTLDQRWFLRSYGILMEKSYGKWKVTRIAADTIDNM